MAKQKGTGKVGSTRFDGRVKVARARFDFAVDGGAVGDITLRGDSLPAGAIVLNAYTDVTTAPTSGGSATVALKLASAADLNAADAIAGAPYTQGVHNLDKMTAGGTRLKLAAAQSVKATVAVAALTAGKFDVLVEYIELT
jgi:hypothetical protein